jgi:hypothetical protein
MNKKMKGNKRIMRGKNDVGNRYQLMNSEECKKKRTKIIK